MDELVIEDKKYISSKRAAQVTGYAKDYIGQLCREGRVPARLVGRNWYVLESALADHRFKTPQKEEKVAEIVRKESVVRMSSGWESPRYEAISAKEIPILKRIQHVETEREVKKEAPEAPAHLHEAWQAWFDHIASQPQTVEAESSGPASAEEVTENVDSEKDNQILDKSDGEAEKISEIIDTEEDTKVPIRAIHHTPLRKAEQYSKREKGVGNEAEQIQTSRPARDREERRPERRRAYMMPFQIAGVAVALIMAGFAGLSTGYFDTSIASLKPASLVAGVSMYQK